MQVLAHVVRKSIAGQLSLTADSLELQRASHLDGAVQRCARKCVGVLGVEYNLPPKMRAFK